jgi:hypothetical protein
MSHRTLPSARRPAIALVVMLVAGALAAPALASEAIVDGNRTYRAEVDPSTCLAPASTQRFTVLLRNTSKQQQLGSANITPGFPISSPSVVTVTAFNGSTRVLPAPELVGGTTLELRSLSAPPGATVTVSFDGRLGAPTVYTLRDGTHLIVKQANNFQGPPGNNLIMVGDAPQIAVGDDCWLEEAGLDLETLASDVCDPSDDPLCEATSTVGDFSAAASGIAVGGPGALYISTSLVDPGDPGCIEPILPGNRKVHRLLGAEGQLAETTLLGFGLEEKRVVFTVSKELDQSDTNNGVSQYEICAKPIEPYSDYSFFQDKYTGNWVVGDAEIDHLPGPLQEWGWLPDCSVTGQPPCVESREKVDGAPVITARTGSGARLK